MLDHLVARADAKTVPITPIVKRKLDGWLAKQPAAVARWVAGTGFKAKPGRHLLLPDGNGAIGRVLLGVDKAPDIWSYGGLPHALPPGSYRIDAAQDERTASRAALGWALGGYAFTRYKKKERAPARLVWPAKADRKAVERTAAAVFLVRDLVNTPAGDMGPSQLAAAARRVALAHGATCKVIVGEALLRANYPAVHAVGRASAEAPRLIDLSWGARGPRIALIGKGVCFDSGGLDLKQSAGMKLMKKDMGGAAHALALAQMIMSARLKVRLRVLIPAVENAVSGNAMHPLDILATRKGITVEVGNTDAEGRLILADALAEADSEKPDLIVDFATLTGAARVALGPDLPALFSNDDRLANAILRHGLAEDDPLWRLPLHRPYRRALDSSIADISSTGDGVGAGAITAALFLAEFVGDGTPWAHIDLMAWNARSRPGRPEGGEAQALRALYALVAGKAAAGGLQRESRKTSDLPHAQRASDMGKRRK